MADVSATDPERIALDLGDRTAQVRLAPHPRARHLRLRLDKARREAVLSFPERRTARGRARMLTEATRFLDAHRGWLAERLAGLAPAVPFEDGAVIPFRGQTRTVRLGGTRGVVERDETLLVAGEADTLAPRLTRWLKARAREDCAEALERHAEFFDVGVASLRVTDTASRWGSCAADGRIALSWRLVLAPPAVLHYVAAHEAAHRLEMNHGPRFWAHVVRAVPDWSTQSDWLKANGDRLHAVGASRDGL